MDPTLDRLVRVLVDAMHPLQIWLFGSRAEGRARPNSDYDLLVVMPDSTPDVDLDPIRAFRWSLETGIPADIIPCRMSEFDEEKYEPDTLARAAFRRGILVHGTR